MHAYRVGELYSPGHTAWPEGVDYNYRSGGHELRLFYHDPTPKEIEYIRVGAAQFAVVADKDLLFLCYKFGDGPWSDAGFSPHFLPEAERGTPPATPATPKTRALLSILLIDAATGILRVVRTVTFSPAFTHTLHQLLIAQAARPWPGEVAYRKQALAFYKGAGSHRMATELAAATCEGETE